MNNATMTPRQSDESPSESRRDLFGNLPATKRDRILLRIAWVFYLLPVGALIVLITYIAITRLIPNSLSFVLEHRLKEGITSEDIWNGTVAAVFIYLCRTGAILIALSVMTYTVFILPYTVILLLRRHRHSTPLHIARSHKRGVLVFWIAFLLGILAVKSYVAEMIQMSYF